MTVILSDADGNEFPFVQNVLVRRETASGPVDLVDFTPPAALTADAINTALGGSGAEEGKPLRGVDLAGSTADAAAIKTALRGAGMSALSDVSLQGAVLYNNNDEKETIALFDPDQTGDMVSAVGTYEY